MPQLEQGYRSPKTQGDITHSLRNLILDGGGLQYLHVSHAPPKEEATRPGTTPLAHALRLISDRETPFVAVSVAEHENPSANAIAFTSERNGRIITLNQILKETPDFLVAKTQDPQLAPLTIEALMRMHGDTVHLMSYLNSHDIAVRESMRGIGIAEPDQFMVDLLDETTIKAAAFVDATIGSWIIKNKGPQDLMDRDDWPPAMITSSLDGKPVKAEIGNNHGLVPELSRITQMHPQLAAYQLQLFGNMVRYNDVLSLHTRGDQTRLMEIADSLAIPQSERPTIVIRNLMPPSFVEFEGKDPNPEAVAPFIEDAVSKGKIIAGVVERLDLLKMDPTLMVNLKQLVIELSQSDQGRTILDNLRIAMVGRPASFPEGWKMREIYTPYNTHVATAIDGINATFRDVMHVDEDFVLVHRDDEGKMTGFPHNSLKSELYPHLNITFQLGQEGLCQTVQEAMLTTTFGLSTPRPAVGIVSEMVGFAEKAQENNLDQVVIVNDPTDTTQTIAAFVKAYNMATAIRENPEAPEITQMVKNMETYYDKCGDSFYVDLVNALIEKRTNASTQN